MRHLAKWMWVPLMVACGGTALPGSGDSGLPVDAASDRGSSLHWFATCGDPVCRAPDADAGTPSSTCGSIRAEDSCSTAGEECDPGSGCNVKLRCAASDPRMQPGGCPISRERYKQDIHYLGTKELEKYRTELLTLPLATYRYRAAPKRERLGFLIDQNENSIAADADRDMVDLYSYTSMAVAALKVQAKQIDELRSQIAELQKITRRQRKNLNK